MSDSYEFTSQQNEELKKLVSVLNGFILCLFMCGAVSFSVLCLRMVLLYQSSPKAIALLLVLAIGVATSMYILGSLSKATKEIKLVIDTEGHDIEHVMKGVKNFSLVFAKSSVTLWVFSALMVGSLLILVVLQGGL